MNRRTFLVSSAAGALSVGCSLAPAGSRVARHHRRTGEFQPNAWIRILPTNTVIFTLDRVEMGQGTTTSHAALVCEELEVDPSVLVIEAAKADRRYDNPDRQLRVQVTGGSTSSATSWRPLREAGAVAREMLRRGAASTWRVPLAECVAASGTIRHSPSGRSATYGELVGAAAQQDVPEVALKPPTAFTRIGNSLDRLDARPKLDGSGVYGIDVSVPGLVTAVLVRGPVRGARPRTIDARATKARRGVLDVVEIEGGIAVVAQGYWEARTGAELLRVEWDLGPNARLDSTAMFASFEALTREPGQRTARDDGDARAAVQRGVRYEAVYRLPYVAHATMEPQNATAWIRDGRCDVWAPTQAPGIARWRVADAIGFDLVDVSIHTTLVGGGFGRRGLVDYTVEAARIAQRIGRPVKVVWSREDDLENDWYRPMQVSRMLGSLDGADIAGWYHRLVCQSIVAHEGGDFAGAIVPDVTPRAVRRMGADGSQRWFARGTVIDDTSVEGAADLPYAIPNLRVEYTPAETGVPVGFWRSVGHSHNAFVTECFLDELAQLAARDPFELRRDLLARRPRQRAVLELAATKAGWGTPLPAGRGRGIAFHSSFDSHCAAVLEVSMPGTALRVDRAVVAIDCGRAINPGLVAAQLESAVVFGLSTALKQQITFVDGRVQQTNFHSFPSLRMHECPVIETHIVPSTADPTGVGEPGVPPIAPALCNAIAHASGIRIRTLPVEPALRALGRIGP